MKLLEKMGGAISLFKKHRGDLFSLGLSVAALCVIHKATEGKF